MRYVLFAAVLLSGCGSSLPSNNNSETINPPAWQQVFAFNGNSIKETESFIVSSNEWRVRWEVGGRNRDTDIFQVFVYDANGNLKTTVANQRGSGSDSNIVRGKGTYYLKILAVEQPYKIVVEEKR